jgi:hypothetical protein
MNLNRETDMKQTGQGSGWSTVVSRALLFSLLWWALNAGTSVRSCLAGRDGICTLLPLAFVERGHGCGVAGVLSAYANHAGTY